LPAARPQTGRTATGREHEPAALSAARG
jgi:hypothetical protein